LECSKISPASFCRLTCHGSDNARDIKTCHRASTLPSAFTARYLKDMPQTPHVESHFTASEFVRDVVIGMADGLTVPFALAAGLSGADITTRIIVVAGLAEIAAGSIAMGLGGYLAARNDADHYQSELRREQREVEEIPEEEAREVLEVFENYGLTRLEAVPIVDSLRQRPRQWIDFMMRFELGLEEPDPKRAVRSACTIAGAYIAGGLIPLAPYMVMTTPYSALLASVGATLLALAVFGAIKGHYTGMPLVPSALRTMVIGGLAAAAAFGIARLVSR
jgi:VIT1/CCC1 family predicted Fe2+/Mn2+ transporter